eukprot:19656-Heterococcus_DN1.PRE.4
MYNGVGLQTTRGSGSSGHVQHNKSHVRPDFFRDRVGKNQAVGGGGSQSWSHSQAMLKKGNDELLEHAKKRKVEAKIFELQEAMVERGYTDAEIEAKVTAVRAELEDRVPNEAAFAYSTKNTHVAAANKEIENAKMRSAFGLSSDYAEGEAFDEAAQARRKVERAAAREVRKEEQKEIRAKERERRDKHKQQQQQHSESSKASSSSRKDRASSRSRSPSSDDADHRKSSSSRKRKDISHSTSSSKADKNVKHDETTTTTETSFDEMFQQGLVEVAETAPTGTDFESVGAKRKRLAATVSRGDDDDTSHNDDRTEQLDEGESALAEREKRQRTSNDA